MSRKKIYQISARQILLLAFASALIAVGATALVYNLTRFWEEKGDSTILAEQAPAPAVADPSTVSDEQNSIDVYRTISPGVAFINTTSVSQDWWGNEQEGKGNGSGSVIDSNGHILTNFHVIEGAQKLTVSFGGDKLYPARVIGGDPDTDLAVIKIEPPAGMTIVPLGDSDKLVVGQKVLAIGNPFGLDRTLTTGVISGLQRPIRARNNRPIDAAIQTDASINPGNSGGPLLDKYGRMIGINSQILSPAGGSVGVGFAVPVNTAKRIVPQLLQFGEVRRPKLGATLPSVADLAARGYRLPVEQGLLIYQTQPNGSADRAGLRGISTNGNIGDIILAVDGQKMSDLDDLYRLLDKKQIGDTVNLEVYRDGRTLNVPVKLLPTSAGGASRRLN
ncbi:MAG: trypsin-like peptidase domain-containing protein [Pyrinomonadaceae bacterium]|nr:trypsin-like peptidase domain-containing protein [Acidobacteriota bacterium]MBP7474482.1 trypsin-like peptidase domain-containing protein [Pyrinomonadaceae bacterium]MBP9108856.1 trypsin-like peptidase domain-containing protein [Pyrinomonadaceae bacterium]